MDGGAGRTEAAPEDGGAEGAQARDGPTTHRPAPPAPWEKGPAAPPSPPATAPPSPPAHQMRPTAGLAVMASLLVLGLVVASMLQALVRPTELIAFRGQVHSDGSAWAFFRVPLMLAAATVSLVWLHRAASNARWISGGRGPSPAWAVGSWFIPVAHIVLPVVPLLQVARASGARAGVVKGWGVAWAVHLALAYLNFLAGSVYPAVRAYELRGAGPTRIELPWGLVALEWAVQFSAVAAGALFVATVWRVSGVQEEVRMTLPQAPGSAPA